jgi:hypothetical protein
MASACGLTSNIPKTPFTGSHSSDNTLKRIRNGHAIPEDVHSFRITLTSKYPNTYSPKILNFHFREFGIA